MRFRRLHLQAFGPFTDLALDLGAESGRMHVFYGKNEAGKSTALRAIAGLLFGIHTGADAHRHRMTELRIGATLEGEDGAVLEVVRRKGLKSTLLDPAGAPMDEGRLRAMLGGVTEGMFRTMFGLDHETLRQGAEALLAGKGDVGESLFGAGLGGGRLRRALEGLRAEADELFTPQGRTKPLNQAIGQFKEAQKACEVAAVAPSAYLDQKRALEEARVERDRNDEEARALAATRSRLARGQRVLPLLARRRAAEEGRHALGEVTLLPESAGRDREDAQREAAEAKALAAGLAREIAELEARAAALAIPRSLLDDASMIEDLQERLGSHRKAALDLPKLLGELGAKEELLAASLQRLGRTEQREAPRAIGLVDPVVQARVRSLSLEHRARVERLRLAARAESDARATLAVRTRALLELPAAEDPSALREALESARSAGDVGGRARRAAGELALLERRVETGIASLGLFLGTAEELSRLPLPPLEAIERSGREWAAFARQREKREEALEDARARAATLERELDAQRRAGHLPTEGELVGARQSRDRAWAELRDATLRGEAWRAEGALELEGQIRRADELADRLRREAERVTRVARLAADRDGCASAIGEGELALAQLEARERTARAEWQAAFAPAGLEPWPPADMARWIASRAALVALAVQLFAARDELASLERQGGELGAELARTLGEEAGAQPLAALVSRAARALSALEATVRARADAEASSATLEREVAELAGAHAAAREELAAWSDAWARSVALLGLGPAASPEEAVDTLEALKNAWDLAEDRDKLARRARGIERDAAAFEADVRALVARHAPDLAELGAEAAAAQLARRFQQGTADVAELGEIERQLAEKRRKLGEAERRTERAEGRIAACLAAAGAPDLAALEEAERRSREARDLDARRADAEEQLLEVGEGASAADLAVELAGKDADGLCADLEAAKEAQEDLDHRRRKNDERIGSRELGLQLFDGAPKAAEQAAIAEGHLAHARELAARYARARLAVAILEGEIERYRAENQGPIVTRASALVRQLTLGSLEGLTTSYGEDDRPALACVRAGGVEIGVEALSDGTRDQLYLALRLATLERYAETNPPMPLVVDDILVHFDDDRARAALELLGELGSRTQVLFFTHHTRLVELARSAVPPGRLAVHTLGE